MEIVTKNQDFSNKATWNVRSLAGKANELIGEFKRENVDVLGITETKTKGSGEMKMEGDHLLIYKGVSGDSRSKEGVGCIINKKYKGYISTCIGETERILSVELKIEENVIIIVTYGPNEDEITCEKDDYWEKLDFSIQDAKDKLIIIRDLNARVWKRDKESSLMAGNQGEIVRNKNG